MILWAILLIVACGGGSGGDGNKNDSNPSSTRSFHLGFTPFPHDISQNAIDYFEPDFLAIGIEVNLLVTNNPAVWDVYLELNQFVYGELKILYPDLPVMVSLFGLALLDGYRGEDDHGAQMQAFDENSATRPALKIWQDTLDKKHVAATNN